MKKNKKVKNKNLREEIVKKVPQRSCVVCRAQKNKNELLRIVKNKENEIKIDTIGKEPGRGAYICYSEECLEKAIKGKKLEKALEIKIEDETYEEIKNIIIKKIGG
jgi:uncharacterized protein